MKLINIFIVVFTCLSFNIYADRNDSNQNPSMNLNDVAKEAVWMIFMSDGMEAINQETSQSCKKYLSLTILKHEKLVKNLANDFEQKCISGRLGYIAFFPYSRTEECPKYIGNRMQWGPTIQEDCNKFKTFIGKWAFNGIEQARNSLVPAHDRQTIRDLSGLRKLNDTCNKNQQSELCSGRSMIQYDCGGNWHYCCNIWSVKEERIPVETIAEQNCTLTF